MTSSAATVNMSSFDVASSEMAFNDMRASNETDILLYNTTGERLSAAEEFWLYEIIPIIISSNSIVIVQPLKRDKKFLLLILPWIIYKIILDPSNNLSIKTLLIQRSFKEHIGTINQSLNQSIGSSVKTNTSINAYSINRSVFHSNISTIFPSIYHSP